MSLTRHTADRLKLIRLLELCQQQIPALEADDMLRFDEILSEKRVLIEALCNGRRAVSESSATGSVVTRIQDADKAAQCLLYQKAGQIMREMNRLNQQEKARGAYQKERPLSAKPIGFLPDTPMFMDKRS